MPVLALKMYLLHKQRSSKHSILRINIRLRLSVATNRSKDFALREHVSAWIKTGPADLLLTGKPPCLPKSYLVLRVSAANEPDFDDATLCVYRPTHEDTPRAYGHVSVGTRTIMNGQVSKLDAFRRLQKPPGSVTAGTIFTDSEDTMELARGWITDCNSRHNLCSQPRRPFLPPARIIDLESR